MKKTLIAIAALAATGAFAQSTVSITGSFESGLVSFDMKGHKVMGIGFNQSSTSGLNFNGTSDLGGGLKANFKLGTDINTVSGSGNTGTAGNVAGAAAPTGTTPGLTNGTAGRFGGAETFVNLTGGFGRIAFGLPNGVGLGAHAASMPFGTAIGSGFRSTSTGYTAVVRYDNSMRYDSPVLAGGLTLTYLGRKQQSDGTNNANYSESLGVQNQARIQEIGAAYNAGPLNVVYGNTVEDGTNVRTATAGTGATALGNRVTANALGANYTMGAATVYAGWQNSKAQNALSVGQRDTTGLNLAVRYVMGTNTFMANMGRISGHTTAASIAANTSTSASLVGLGYEYALSKTAAVTARYERVGDNATLNAAAVTGYTAVAGNNDRTRMGVGIRVGF